MENLKYNFFSKSEKVIGRFYTDHKFLNIANSIIGLIAIFSVYFVVTCSAVNADSAYYLSVSKLISKGLIPFKEVLMLYPPLCFYVFSAIYYLFGNLSYESMLGFMIVIKFIDSVILFFIGRYIKVKWNLAIFLSLVYFLSTLLYEGDSVLLENFVVCFQLLSILFIIKIGKSDYFSFLSGITLALAVLSKQYGLFIFPGLLVFITLSTNSVGRKLFQIILLILGFLLPIVLCVSYYWYKEVSFDYIIFSLGGSGYGERSIRTAIVGGLNLIVRNGLYLLFIPFLIYSRKTISPFLGLILVCSAASFSPLYIHYYPHYFLLILPFLFLVKLYIIETLEKCDIQGVLQKSLFITVLISLIVIFLKDVKQNIICINKDGKERQLRISRIIIKEVKQKEKVMSYSQSEWNYLCDFSPLDAKLGAYQMPGFGYEANKKELSRFIPYNKYVKMAKEADFLILRPGDYLFFEKNDIFEGFKKKLIIEKGVEIWERTGR